MSTKKTPLLETKKASNPDEVSDSIAIATILEAMGKMPETQGEWRARYVVTQKITAVYVDVEGS